MSVRSLLVAASGAIALASASPAPQDIPFDLAYALPNPSYTTDLAATAQTVTYNPTTVFAAAAVQITETTNTALAADATTGAPNKRAVTACTPLPSGYGPIPSPDSPSAFAALPDFASAASNAPVPTGYTQTFSNLAASNNAYGYMGYTTLQTYDSNLCASKCNAINGCISFNLYYERDPSVEPGTGNTGCSNPASTTNIKCVFWGGPVNSGNTLNNGQWRNQFQVVIAGSNGYVNNTVAQVPGYAVATPLGNAAINPPYDSFGFDSYMGSAMFVGAYNAALCAQACTDKSNYAIAHPPTDGTPVQTCQFFNTYILYINSTKDIQGQVCAMYSESWPSSYATNVGQYRGNDHFLLEYSYSYSNATNPGSAQPLPAVYQAKRDVLWPANSALPYCSSLLGYTTPLTTTTISATASTTTTTTTTTTTAGAAATNVRRSDAVITKPQVLSKYPASILSSGCALAATPVTQTSTITSITTVITTTSTSTSTSVTTSTVPASSMPTCDPSQAYNGAGGQGGCSADCYCNADIDAVNSYCGSTCGADDCTVPCTQDSDCASGEFCDSFDFNSGYNYCYSIAGCSTTYSPPTKRNALAFMAPMARKAPAAPVVVARDDSTNGSTVSHDYNRVAMPAH